MKKLFSIFILTAICLTACSQGVKDPVGLLTEYLQIQEDCAKVNMIAVNSEDFIEALKTYTSEMNRMYPQMKKYIDQYPDFDEETLAELELLNIRAKSFTENIRDVIPISMLRFASDPEVKEEVQKMSDSIKSVY